MINVREFHYPTTVKQTLQILQKLGGGGLVVAGGSTLATWKDPHVWALVDINRLGLGFVKAEEGGLVVGATTTMQALMESEAVKTYAGGIISTSAASVRSRLLRNMVTMAGHVVPTTPWTELSPALLAVDAVVTVARPGARDQRIPYAEFAAENQYRGLGRRELVTQVELDGAWAKAGSSYLAFQRTAAEPAWSIVAVTVTLKERKVTACRIAVGAVARTASRLYRAEEFLIGTTPERMHLEAAASAGVEGLAMDPDFRASPSYRREITRVLIRRALAAALGTERNSAE
jgi:carbon-monoxide dehydrogenase medium subunit